MKHSYLVIFILLFAYQQMFAQSNEVHIEQVGNSHQAQIDQEASLGGSNGTYIGNFPGQGVDGVPPGNPFQESSNASGGTGSYAEILQFNTGHIASITQAGTQWAKIYQDGFNNLATITQDGNGGGVSFNPPGVASPCPPAFAPCNATSENGSVASVYQDGDQNTATIEQDQGSNEAKIVQYGSDLEAIILQYGDGNYASILQDFRGSSLQNSLAGFKTAKIEQSNNNNIATVEQSIPLSSPIEIVQHGNMEVHIEHH